MLKAKHYNMDGKLLGEVDLPEVAFGVEPNEHVVWEAVKCYLANQRRGTSATKTFSMVRGGGRKPFRQKGTGRARQGSSRAPQYVGGATVFGPQPRDYSYRIPKKLRRLALASALSQRASEGNVTVLDEPAMAAPKTKSVAVLVKAIGLAERKVCFITSGADRNFVKSCRNMPGVTVLPHSAMNVYALIDAEVLIVTPTALEGIKEAYGS